MNPLHSPSLKTAFRLGLVSALVALTSAPTNAWAIAGTKDGGGSYAYSWTSVKHLRHVQRRFVKALSEIKDQDFEKLLARDVRALYAIDRARLLTLISEMEFQFEPADGDADSASNAFFSLRADQNALIARPAYFSNSEYDQRWILARVKQRLGVEVLKAASVAFARSSPMPEKGPLLFAGRVLEVLGHDNYDLFDNACGYSGDVSERILDCDERKVGVQSTWELVMVEPDGGGPEPYAIWRDQATGIVRAGPAGYAWGVAEDELQGDSCPKLTFWKSASPFGDWRMPTVDEASAMLKSTWGPPHPERADHCLWAQDRQLVCADGRVGKTRTRNFWEWFDGKRLVYPVYCVAHSGTESAPRPPIAGSENLATTEAREAAPPVTAERIQNTRDNLKRAQQLLIRALSSLPEESFAQFARQYPSARIDRRALIEAIRSIRLDENSRRQRKNNYGLLEPLLFDYDRAQFTITGQALLVDRFGGRSTVGQPYEELLWRILHEASHLFGIGINGNDLDSVNFGQSLRQVLKSQMSHWADGSDHSACGTLGDIAQKIADCDQTIGFRTLVSRPAVRGSEVWRDNRTGKLQVKMGESQEPTFAPRRIEKICEDANRDPQLAYARWRTITIEEGRDLWTQKVPVVNFFNQESDHCVWAGGDHEVVCRDGTVTTKTPKIYRWIAAFGVTYEVYCFQE